MLQVFVAAVIFVGLCVLGLGFNIFFRKNGKFPQTEISANEDMRRLGIKCAKEEELERLSAGRRKDGVPCDGNYGNECEGCALYGLERKTND